MHELQWQRARARAERVLTRAQRWQLARERAERTLGRTYDPNPPHIEPRKSDGSGNGETPAEAIMSEVELAQPRQLTLLAPLIPLFPKFDPDQPQDEESGGGEAITEKEND